MFFSSTKEINRLISTGMSNIYLKVTFKKNRISQASIFLRLKICSNIKKSHNIMNMIAKFYFAFYVFVNIFSFNLFATLV